MKMEFKQFTDEQMKEVHKILRGKRFNDEMDLLLTLWENGINALMTYTDAETITVTMMPEI